jgi:hypothetical protein
MFPAVHIVLGTRDSYNQLAHQSFIFFDGTFELCECKLILSTVLGSVSGVIIPLTFLLSATKTSDAYFEYFSQITIQTGNVFAPEYILGDYDKAQQAGAKKVHSDLLCVMKFLISDF